MNCSRRTFLGTVGSAALVMGGTAHGAEPAGPYHDIELVRRWLDAAMASATAASGTLHLGRFADPIYYLLKRINWSPNPGQAASPVEVPVGFVTDFASVPRAFWVMLPPDALYTYAAIVHDYLYWEQPIKRKQADLILKFAMQDFKVGSGTIEAVYNGVRLGGRIAWNDNARRRKAGEKRVLKRFPEDPTTTWASWTQGDVF